METTRRGLFKFLGAAAATAGVAPKLAPAAVPVSRDVPAKPKKAPVVERDADTILFHAAQVVDLENVLPQMIDVTSHSSGFRQFAPLYDAGRIAVTLTNLTSAQNSSVYNALYNGIASKFSIEYSAGARAEFTGTINSRSMAFRSGEFQIKLVIQLASAPTLIA